MKKRNCRSFYPLFFSLIFALTLTVLSVTAFANSEFTENDVERILSTYYYTPNQTYMNITGDLKINDPYMVLDINSTIDNQKLIPTFCTKTENESTMLELCEKIGNGEMLFDLLNDNAQFYTITTDDEENDTGYAIIGTDDLSVLEFGELNEYTRKDFRSVNMLRQVIADNELNVSDAKMVFCIIDNFSTGTLLCDGSKEYFIPSVEGIESAGILEVGEMYLVSDVFDLIEANIDTIFQESDVDENGNPYLGGGTPASTISNDAMKVERNRDYTYILISAIGFVGGIICFALAYKNTSKSRIKNHF